MIFTFFIKDLYTTTEIEEPEGWKDLMSELDRQFDTHGMFFSYAGGGDKAGTVFELGFACEGKTLLEAEYQAKGTEGFYQFGVDEAANEFVTPTNIFLGDIDFETRGFDEEFFTAQINQITNLVKLKNRGGLKTSFNKQLTHDGITVSKLNSQDIVLLATKQFRQLRANQTGITISDQSAAVSTTTLLRGQVGFNSLESIELNEFTNIESKFQLLDVDSFLTLTKKSALTFNLIADFDLDITEDQGSGTTTYIITLTLISSKPSSDGTSVFLFYDAFNPSGASPFDFSDSQDFDIDSSGGIFEAGTSFKFQMFISMGTTGTAQFSVDWTIRNFQIMFVDFSADLGTIAKCYHPFDSLNKTLNFITGEYDYLFSDLLGDIDRGYDVNGCFSTMRQTNGYRVRQINDDDKAPIESFKGFIDNLDAPGAIGYGIEELESPEILGQFIIQWKVQGPPTHTIWVDGNLVYDIFIGTKITFYNSEFLFGTYEVTAVSFIGVTVISFTSTGTDLNITIGLFMSDVFIMSDNATEFRDRLRVEKWEHFYKDTQLIDLGVVQDYSEDPFTESLYNKFDLGFRKFANDEDKPTTLEDFETKSSWGLPLVNTRKALTKIMTWIMSSFMINESRGTLFKEKPTTSNKLDDDIFLFDVVPSVTETTVSFVHNVSSDDTITVSANVYENYIRDESVFSIEDATIPGNNQGYLYEASETIHLLPADTYKIFVSQTVTSDAADPCTVNGFYFDGTQFSIATKAESTEKLVSSSGLSGPDYTYNQRRTIKRFLIRWGRFINSVLGYISDTTQTIQNLFYTSNGVLTTEIDTSQLSTDCLMGDLSGASIQEDDNINTDSFPVAKFKPNIINCTVKICDTDYEMILAAHKNRLQAPDDVKNYGYFSATSPKGKQVSGWLMNMKRSPINRIAKLRLLEKFTAFDAGSGIYNFSGVEKVTIPGIPAFERTSTFYFKTTVQNTDSAFTEILWDNIGDFPNFDGIRIWLTGSTSASQPNTVGAQLSNDGGLNRVYVYSDEIITPESGFRDIEISYDGSSNASGFILTVDGDVLSFNILVDGLSASIDVGTGVSIGIAKNLSITEGGFILDSLEMTYDSTQVFKTLCANNGLTCVDLSSQGNSGIIDLGATDPLDFFLNE